MGLRVFLYLALSLPALAGNIYGTLREKGNPLAGVRIEISHPQLSSPAVAITESNGSYRVFVKPTGRCTLRVLYGKDMQPESIFSYDDPVKYDFDVVVSGGRYSLHRR